MSKRCVPDFEKEKWRPLYCTDLYYNPETEKYEPVRLVEPIPKEMLIVQKRLARHWYAKIHVFRHPVKLLEGFEIRVFDKDAVERRWGPIGDRDLWTTAAWLGDRWWVVKKQEDCEYDYWLSKDKKALVAIEFSVNGAVIGNYEKYPKDPS